MDLRDFVGVRTTYRVMPLETKGPNAPIADVEVMLNLTGLIVRVLLMWPGRVGLDGIRRERDSLVARLSGDEAVATHWRRFRGNKK